MVKHSVSVSMNRSFTLLLLVDLSWFLCTGFDNFVKLNPRVKLTDSTALYLNFSKQHLLFVTAFVHHMAPFVNVAGIS